MIQDFVDDRRCRETGHFVVVYLCLTRGRKRIRTLRSYVDPPRTRRDVHVASTQETHEGNIFPLLVILSDGVSVRGLIWRSERVDRVVVEKRRRALRGRKTCYMCDSPPPRARGR